MNKLDMKLYDVLPIAYDDSLSYPEAVHNVVDYINKLIEDGTKKYDNVINEIESELQNLKSDVNEQLKEQRDKRTDDVNKEDAAINAEITNRQMVDSRFIQLIEAALKNVKSYYSRGFILIGNTCNSANGWTKYVKDHLDGVYQCVEVHNGEGGFVGNSTPISIGEAYRSALAKVTVPERITDIVFLTGMSETHSAQAYEFLREAADDIHRGTPNATFKFGYFGETMYPNKTADDYEKLLDYAKENNITYPFDVVYLADSRYLTGNIDFWNTEKTALTSEACDKMNPYILQLVLDGHVSYNFTRSVTADLPVSFTGSHTAVKNSVTIDESYSQNGFRFTASSTTSFTDDNTETLGSVFMIPTPETAEDVITLADSKDTNADPNFSIATRIGTTGWDGYSGPYYFPAVIFIDTDGVLKIRLLSKDRFVTNGVGFFVI